MLFDIKVIQFMHFQNFILQAVRGTVYTFYFFTRLEICGCNL